MHPFLFDVSGQVASSAAHPPLWTLVLAGFGAPGEERARVVGAIAGAAAVVLCGLLARRLAGDRAGLVAAGIAALYPAWILGDGSGMSEGLYLLLVAAALLALLRPSPALAGVVIGLAALARTEGLFLLAFAAAPLLWRRWRKLAIVVAAAALALAPWAVRNAIELDRFVPVSTNTETVIAGANCDDTWYGRETGSWSVDCFARAGRGPGLERYDEGVLAGRWRAAGADYAADHLGRAPVVAAVRVLRTWRLWQPLREGELTEGVPRHLAKAGALVFLLVLLPLGAFGLWRARRELVLLAVGLALMVTLTSAIGWGSPRFLRPAELGLILGAAAYVAGPTRWASSGARPMNRMVGSAHADGNGEVVQ